MDELKEASREIEKAANNLTIAASYINDVIPDSAICVEVKIALAEMKILALKVEEEQS